MIAAKNTEMERDNQKCQNKMRSLETKKRMLGNFIAKTYVNQ
jgi:hypothetical protein